MRQTGHVDIDGYSYYYIPTASLGSRSAFVRAASAAAKSSPVRAFAASEEELVDLYVNLYYFLWLYGFHVLYTTHGRCYEVIPGHFLLSTQWGPVRPLQSDSVSPILVLGSMPSWQELRERRNFVGDFGRLLVEQLSELDQVHLQSVYVANRSRVYSKLRIDALAAMTDFNPVLLNELLILRPNLVLCLGADALKYFTRKPIASVQKEPTECWIKHGDIQHKLTVYAAPLKALHEHHDLLKFQQCTRRFITHGVKNMPYIEPEVRYTVLSTEAELNSFVDAVLRQAELLSYKMPVSVDCEWHGLNVFDHPAYLRCIAFAVSPNMAYIVPIADETGAACFQGDPVPALRRLFDPGNNIQIVGYNLTADMAWLETLVPVLPKFEQIDDDDLSVHNDGVFDVMYAYHTIDECGEYGLEEAAWLFLGVSGWSQMLEAFLADYCKKSKIPRNKLRGYGPVPTHILYPYVARDVAYTYALAEILRPRLVLDRFDHNCVPIYKRTMRALLGFYEMHKQGIRLDLERYNALIDVFQNALQRLINEFRQEANWPDFNHNSYRHRIEFLFGEAYTDDKKRHRPEGALSLYLSPPLATDSDGAEEESEEEDSSGVSSDLETLLSLRGAHPLVSKLLDIRLLSHAISYVLQPPVNGKYERGLAAYICTDGKIHPTYYPLRETRRCSSSNPSLQNLAANREEDYKRILGDSYRFPIRSVFCADEDHVLVAVDYVSAEILMLAVSANDPVLIEDYYRSALPDDDPRKIDIHSLVAVMAFKLPCPPTKAGLASIGKEKLRHCAKRIIFGLNYGASLRTCYEQIKLQVPEMTFEEVQQVADYIYSRYSRIRPYQEQLRARVRNPGWIVNSFGSYRRFGVSRQADVLAKAEREAVNFVCQSGVADAVAIAMYNFYSHPAKQDLGYRLVLHNHDELILTLPEKNYDQFLPVIKECVHDKVKLNVRDLDGCLVPNSPEYRFMYEVHKFRYWYSEED